MNQYTIKKCGLIIFSSQIRDSIKKYKFIKVYYYLLTKKFNKFYTKLALEFYHLENTTKINVKKKILMELWSSIIKQLQVGYTIIFDTAFQRNILIQIQRSIFIIIKEFDIKEYLLTKLFFENHQFLSPELKIYLLVIIRLIIKLFIQILFMSHMINIKKIINLQISLYSKLMQGKRTIESQGPLISTNNKLGVDFKLTPNPHYLESRIKMFQQIKKKIDELYTNIEKPEITIKLKDGKEIKGQAFLSTPYSIAKSISKNLAQNSIVAKVTYTKRLEFPLSKGCVSAELQQQSAQQDGQYIDLNRPLEGDCLLELFTFEDKKGKQVFWHSSAHLLGQILELNYGAWLTHGPSLDNGFFYDSFMGSHRLSQTDYQKLENDIKKSVQQKQPYERIILTKNQALQMFADNPFKVQLIQSKVPQNSLTSAYKCGKLIDLCTGPHIPNSEKVKGFKITKNSSAYWLGNNQNDDLQRVYAISFPKQSLLQEYIKTQQELAKRDHRNIGPKQGLFNFSPLSPGSAFFFPDGAIIYNKLQSLIRQQYKLRGYQQVITPNIYNQELWKISGHYFKYKQNIYFIHQDGESHGLKPMNCPGHCLMFDMIQRSYRDLPIRFADFGVLHRNQVHGALSGLTRVRRFQQDDAHIFCMPQQIQNQIVGVLEFLDYIYSLFDFKYKLQLSTRPQKFLGQIEVWNKAQSQLKEALKKFGKDYIINEGDGAFYGPKIDVKLFDAFGRQHQCGTVQLDFQLPLRFNLQYRFKQQKVEQNKTEKVQQKLKQKKEKKQKKKKDQKEEKQQQGKQLLQSQIVEKPNQTEVINEIIPENISEQAKYDKIGELKNGFNRPVMIHRAILGSLQRMIAILCQHTGGKWPFWLSPRQLILIPIGAEGKAYAELILNRLVLLGYNVNVDNSGQTLNKKIRNAQLENYNYIGVIGNEQVQSQTIDLRDREKSEQIGKFSLEKLINLFKSLEVAKSQKMIQIQGKAAKI